jgi:hypothetical protein
MAASNDLGLSSYSAKQPFWQLSVTPNTSIWVSTVLTGFRLQEPFVKKRFPCLSSYDAIYSQILVLLVVLDRRSRGRAKLAILDQDWKAPPLVEHELKMFNYRWAALRVGASLQHWEAKGNLNVSHLTAPFFASCNGRSCILRGLSSAVADAKTATYQELCFSSPVLRSPVRR